MKNIFFIAAIFFGISTKAQVVDSLEIDTTVFEMGKHTIVIYSNPQKDSLKVDLKENEGLNLLTTLDFGVNGYLTPTNEMTLPTDLSLMELDYSKSRSFSLNFLLEGIDFAKKRLFFTTGFGFDWKSYQFKNDIIISPSNDSTEFTPSGLSFDKYKLKATYFQVPVMFGFRLGKIKKPLSVQFGAIGGYKIGSKTKSKYQIDGIKYKSQIKDDYNLSPFKLSATTRIKIAGIGIFANYALTPMFEKVKAPELYPFSIGLTFGEFK